MASIPAGPSELSRPVSLFCQVLVCKLDRILRPVEEEGLGEGHSRRKRRKKKPEAER